MAENRNRLCVFVGEIYAALNDSEQPIQFCTAKPEKIGDNAIIRAKSEDGRMKRRTVMYLRSEGMVEDRTYLVDFETKEAWEYSG